MRSKRKSSVNGFTLVELVITLTLVCVVGYLLLPRTTGNKAKPERIICTNNLKQIGLAYRQWAEDHNSEYPMNVSITNGGTMEAVLSGDVAFGFQVMSNELVAPKILLCPADKVRTPATVFAAEAAQGKQAGVHVLSNSNINYFVGLDANQAAPQMFLAGDDNWLIGGRNGYNGAGQNGSPVKPGLQQLGTNTLIAWADSRHGKQGNVGLADGSVQGFSSSKLAEGLRHTGVATNRLVFP